MPLLLDTYYVVLYTKNCILQEQLNFHPKNGQETRSHDAPTSTSEHFWLILKHCAKEMMIQLI